MKITKRTTLGRLSELSERQQEVPPNGDDRVLQEEGSVNEEGLSSRGEHLTSTTSIENDSPFVQSPKSDCSKLNTFSTLLVVH